MIGFDGVINTVSELQDELNSLQKILIESDSDPEVLLKEYVLPTESDRMYVLTRLMVKFGEEKFNAFIFEYFDKILKVLSTRIPIDEVVLAPSYYDDEYVIIGSINDKPQFVINTFEKTVSLLPDEYSLKIYEEIENCQALIYELEQQLNNIPSMQNNFTLNKKRQAQKIKTDTDRIIAQLGIEKQTLSRLKDTLTQYQLENSNVQELSNRYVSRLRNYYQYVILKTEG
jgi:hypothetical protein